jgi:hypothetical protein
MIIAEAHDSSVGLRDRLHNGQSQTAAPPGARGRGETDEGMSQIAVGEAHTMITNLYLDGVVGVLTDELHTPRTMGQCVVHEVAQGVLQALLIGQDHALV